MTSTVETPSIRIIWPKTGAELDLAALQGLWTAEQYLALTEQTNQLIEFAAGVIEALPIPSRKHQAIIAYLYRPAKYREPDLLLLRNARDPRNQQTYWLGTDLVIEIASPDDPERDTVVKRADYVEAGIPEYWIVTRSMKRSRCWCSMAWPTPSMACSSAASAPARACWPASRLRSAICSMPSS